MYYKITYCEKDDSCYQKRKNDNTIKETLSKRIILLSMTLQVEVTINFVIVRN